jgi:iron complex transport system substrate-binding protein
LLLRIAASVWLLCAALVGCGRRAAPPGAGVTDDAGRPLRLHAPPRRIVSLSPATTELLFDLGVGDRIVGRTRWCEDPPEALGIPSVGDGFAPNVEAVVAREPELVVFYHTPANAAAIARLEAMGVSTVSLRIDRIADLTRAAGLLGRLLDVELRADSLLRRLETAVGALRPEAPSPPPGPSRPSLPSVAIISWDNPPIVIGATSFLSEIVVLAEARNAFGDVAQPSLTVSVESIAARDPDFLLVHGDDSVPAFLQRPEWQVIRAARERRLLHVHGTEFGHPSFRVVQAVEQLRERLARSSREAKRGMARAGEERAP